jgi:5-methylcytosine-specific restriction protein A
MTTEIMHPCPHPGCGVRIPLKERHCDRHTRLIRQSYDRSRKDDPFRKFYSSAAWRRARAQQLREHPLCEECRKRGRIVRAVIADHITPVRAGGDLFGPLRSLCWSCHSAHHITEGSRYGKR